MSALKCPVCRKDFDDEHRLTQHRVMTHDNPEWVANKAAKRSAMGQRPVPICPRCGQQARVDHTQFGPRATCCGMHSWGMKPLKDATNGRSQSSAYPGGNFQ